MRLDKTAHPELSAEELRAWRDGYRRHLEAHGIERAAAAKMAARVSYRADLYPSTNAPPHQIPATIERIRKTAHERESNAPPKGAEIIQLPLWPEPKRGMPNPALRSALFAAIHSKDRRFINDELLAACEGVEIRFKGEQLNQDDLEVCSLLFHVARVHPLGDTCHFTAHAMLKELGRDTSGEKHQDLHQSIRRLQQPLEIKYGRYRYFGAFVLKGVKDDITKHYNLTLNPDLARLFAQGWTALEWEQRQRLRGKHLALWLHGYYASHAAPLPLKVATLRDWCGSMTKALNHFRRNLRAALGQLKAVDAIAGWTLEAESDLVTVDRGTAITASQRRHLTHTKSQSTKKPTT